MKLSTRTKYSIRAIIEIASHYGKGPLQSKIIAQRQDLSVKYLEQLIAILKSADFVRSIRGAKGGYVLSRPPKDIKLSEVFRALEGSVVTVECLENDDYCNRTGNCVSKELWAEVEDAVYKVLESKTLQDMVDRANNKKELFYQI
ncbi:MAG: RrF2 family transcriptional regulator [Planctomycetota bacterium]|jgi:Rrf2 family protein